MVININSFVLPNMSSEDQNLYNQVVYCIFKYRKLLLAYSGGLDSTVLLDILSTLVKYINSFVTTSATDCICLRAIYVHHGFSNQSDYWAQHCAQQCEIRNIPFDIVYINCFSLNEKRRNLESLARNLRYQKLFQSLDSEEVLLTAHHMDDQVETVLLALKRGSGPTGLSGIYKDILYNCNHRVLRPLLECSRIQLEKYAFHKKLIWIEDHTNSDTHFDRNFLRIRIIPLLKKRWPSFNKVVLRTSQVCRNQNNLLNELLLNSLNKLMHHDGSLFFYPLLKYSTIKRQALLRCWLKHFFINMPSYQLLDRIWKEVALSKIDAQPKLYLGQYICRRFRKKLYILPVNMANSVKISPIFWKSLDNIILLPYNLGQLVLYALSIKKLLSYNKIKSSSNDDKDNLKLNVLLHSFKKSDYILTNCVVRAPEIDETVSVRFGYVSDLLYIVNRKHGRKLKKIWQELNIPPWIRSRIPLLFYNNVLIAAIGVFITQHGQVTAKIKNNNKNIIWRIFWLQDTSYYKIFKNIIHNFLE